MKFTLSNCNFSLMAKESISYKDLSKTQLDILKDIYIESYLASMSETDLRKFVQTIIQDQIKGTVGNDEEREAWKEMKDFFADMFESRVEEVMKISTDSEEITPNEQKQLEKRLELLEQRKQEKSQDIKDMW